MKIKLLTILLTLLPLMTWAQGTTAGDETNAEPYAVLSENNTVLTFYYDDQKTTRNGLEVGPFNGDGIQTWYWQRESIINAVFDSSFANCTSITSTAHWFNGCKNMSSVSGIQYLKTDNVTDMKDMFSYCRSLPSIDVSGFNTSNVMTMSGMFALCESLTSLDVSGFKTDKVINMSSMFNSCKSLTTLDVSGFNTANVTDMAGMFFSCTSLTDLNLSNFNTANVTTMNSMFHYCIGLTNLDVSNFNTEKVTSMASMFWNCHSLTSLNISSFVTPYVTNVEDMFSECSSLTTILVGKGWSTGQISNGESMFAGCVNLVGEAGTTFDESHIDFTYAHIDGGISNPGYFSGNGVPYAEPYAALSNQNTVLTFYYDDQKKARQGMSIGPFSSDYIYNSGYIGWEQQRDSITSVVFDDSFSNYTDLISTVGWFFNCSKLETVSGLQNIHLGKLEDMSYMFYHCSALKSLDLSYFSEANLTKIEYMLTGCSGLTDLNLGGFNTANITDMNSMFSGCSGLTSLDLSSLNTENVTSMSSMFSGCSGLTSLDLSNFKTEHVTSMAAMFNNCSHLTSLDLSNFNTENVTTMYYMFNGCSRLKSLNMSGLNMTSLNDILYMFSGCSYLESIDLSNSVLPNLYRFFYGLSSLKELNLSNCNTSKMTTMKEMFSGCSKLITLDLSSFNTTNVTDMYCMFYDCPDLVSIDLSSFNTVNVTSMKSMFSACPNLMSIDVSGFNTESVTDMSSMFLSCPGLTSLDVTNFNTANVTNISHMFGSCTGLTSLDLRNFNTGNVTDMGYMFSGCTSLNTIYAGEGWSTAKVSSSSYMFHQCTSLVGGAGTVFDSSHTDHTYARIDGGTDNPGYFTRIGDAPYTEPEPYAVLSDDNTVLTFYYDNQKEERNGMDVTLIGGLVDLVDDLWTVGGRGWNDYCKVITTAVFDPSFADCTSITSTSGWFCSMPELISISGLNYLNTANVTDMSHMFRECSKLESLDVSNFNTGKVENMWYMFLGCSSLTSLDVSRFNTENVTNIAGMFMNCSGLTSLDVSGFKTNKVTNMKQMFSDCSNLTSLDLSGFNTENVTRMDDMFFMSGEPSKLKSLDLSSFNTEKVESMFCMFYNCSNLESLNVSSFNTANVTNMEHMFHGCSSLTSLDLSSFNTSKVIYDENTYNFGIESMFADCSKLATIFVSEAWTTANLTQGEYVFYNCTNLVGGMGTKYNPDHTDYTYAHIDEGPSNPGYFTNIAVTAELETVETPTFRFAYVYDTDLTIETETPDAEIYYTLNGRMLEDDDTNFGYNSLSKYSRWSVWGDNKLEAKIERGGYNGSYCLMFASKTDSLFEAAQAGYKFSRALTEGDYYTIRFMARSKSGNGKLQFYCQNDTLPNTRSVADTLTIGSQFADYEVTVKIDNDKTNQFVLNFGAVADTYYIDNVLFGPVISETTNQLRTLYERPIELRQGMTIKAVAVKQGMKDSEPAVWDYFYEGWMNLLEIYEKGRWICESAYGNPNVPLPMVEDVRVRLEDMLYRYYERRTEERFDDSELLAVADEMMSYASIIESMMRGFIVDGVSYHATDSTHAEVIASLDYYTPYRNAITVAKEVHYNDLDFQVISVAQGAFANSELAAIVWNPIEALKYEDVAVINNPNLLVYVNEASLAPENIKNVVVNNVAKNIELVDASNNNFYCPEPFTAETISYTREFRQETMIGISRGWEGIALPFDVQTIMHEKNGTITPFGRNDNNKHFWLRRLSSNGLVPADKMEANVPYIISMPNCTDYPAEYNLPGRVTFFSANVTVPVTETRTLALADSTIVMSSTMQRMSHSSSYYALNVGEVRGQYMEGSVFERDYREVHPFEAYTIHRGNTPAPRFVPIKELNGGATGIEDVRSKMEDGRGPVWYDLHGRRLQQKPDLKGVYLQNGRKVVVR